MNLNLRAHWLNAALRYKSEGLDRELAVSSVDAILEQDVTGQESRRRSLRCLRQIWLDPHPQLSWLQDLGVIIYRDNPTKEQARFLSFFMMCAVYPFARQVAEVCGQLNRIQGTIKTEQVKRKMCSILGERESVIRSARHNLSILSEMGFLEETSQRGIYTVCKLSYFGVPGAAFALKALFCSRPNESFSRSELDTHSALFAFDSYALVEDALADPSFSVSRESVTREMVSFR
jgi:hypothetical protein